jgi:hypothetical protein
MVLFAIEAEEERGVGFASSRIAFILVEIGCFTRVDQTLHSGSPLGPHVCIIEDCGNADIT